MRDFETKGLEFETPYSSRKYHSKHYCYSSRISERECCVALKILADRYNSKGVVIDIYSMSNCKLEKRMKNQA